MTTKYIESYELPSGCLLEGYEEIPEDIVLRAMTTKEEKMLLGSTGDSVYDKILGNCIDDPKNLPIGKLILADKHFLMMKLRILSYGSLYHAKIQCDNRNCRETHEYEIDLDDLLVYKLDENFVEPYEFELPANGDTIGIRLLRDRDSKKIAKRAKQINRKSKNRIDGDISYILRMAKRLVTINGEEVEGNKGRSYIESLIGRDSAYIKNKVESIEVGYDLTIYEDCPYCGYEVEFTLPMTSEFFRPRFDD